MQKLKSNVCTFPSALTLFIRYTDLKLIYVHFLGSGYAAHACYGPVFAYYNDSLINLLRWNEKSAFSVKIQVLRDSERSKLLLPEMLGNHIDVQWAIKGHDRTTKNARYVWRSVSEASLALARVGTSPAAHASTGIWSTCARRIDIF